MRDGLPASVVGAGRPRRRRCNVSPVARAASELCHQYTVSDAAYPAGPHLVRLAAACNELRTHLLVLLGMCHAFSEPLAARAVPVVIVEEWHSAGREAMPLIAGLLGEPPASGSELRYLLCAVAAVRGYPSLASAIEALDTGPE
jgi:hypothetical protein